VFWDRKFCVEWEIKGQWGGEGMVRDG